MGRKDRRSSCSLGDSESGYQAPPCYTSKLQLFLQPPKLQEQQLSRWPCLRSTSRSTWNSMPRTFIFPWAPTSTGTIKPSTDLLNTSGRSPGRSAPMVKLMEYQTKRGGRVVFQDIAKPTTMEWGTPLEAMEAALELEKTVNQSLLDLHKVA